MSEERPLCQDCQSPCKPEEWRSELIAPKYLCASCWAWYQTDRCVFICDNCGQRQAHGLCHTCGGMCRVESWLKNMDYVGAVPFRRNCPQCDEVFREFIPQKDRA